MSAGSIGFDTTEIRAFARKFDGAEKIVMDELSTAFSASGNDILAGARGNINNKTGELSGSGSSKTNVSARLIITVVRFTAKHAKWVEWGRGPVVAKAGKMLRFEIGGQVLFRKRVGPAKAQFFLRRSFDARKNAITQRVDAAAARIVARVLA